MATTSPLALTPEISALVNGALDFGKDGPIFVHLARG